MYYAGPIRDQSNASVDLLEEHSPLRMWVVEGERRDVHYGKEYDEVERIHDGKETTLQRSVQNKNIAIHW